MKKKDLNFRKNTFVELFIKYEGDKLSDIDIRKLKRRDGIKHIYDGEFWWKICNEFAKKISI